MIVAIIVHILKFLSNTYMVCFISQPIL